MDGLTVGQLISIWVDAILRNWLIITGVVTVASFGIKYLLKRATQQQTQNDLLTGILKSSESMDLTIKAMSEKMTNMNLEVKLLRSEHDALEDKHNDLKQEVAYIKRTKQEII